jgi:hypothetical protein
MEFQNYESIENYYSFFLNQICDQLCWRKTNLAWLKSDCGHGHGHANAIISHIQEPELAKKIAQDAENEVKKKR